VAAERETLEGFLEYHRRVLSGKLRGLSEEDARRRLVPSLTTMLGLVSHAAAVERNWFQHYLGGKPREEITGNARGDAPSWDVGADKTIASVIAGLDSAARHPGRSRRASRWTRPCRTTSWAGCHFAGSTCTSSGSTPGTPGTPTSSGSRSTARPAANATGG
jgi:hypothetical protein